MTEYDDRLKELDGIVAAYQRGEGIDYLFKEVARMHRIFRRLAKQ